MQCCRAKGSGPGVQVPECCESRYEQWRGWRGRPGHEKGRMELEGVVGIHVRVEEHSERVAGQTHGLSRVNRVVQCVGHGTLSGPSRRSKRQGRDNQYQETYRVSNQGSPQSFIIFTMVGPWEVT